MPATPLAGDSQMPRVQHAAFGQSQRMVVAPGQEQNGILVIPAGQSGHPLSPFYRADHRYWQAAIALPFLPGPEKYQQQLLPAP
jgi:penicillin amidase